MEFDRRVQIRVSLRDEEGKGFGTGYLVAPRLVLTADHILDDLDPDGEPHPVTVCQPDTDEREYPATVIWQQQDETVDVALVEIAADCGWPVPESLSDLTARPPQRYGRLIGTRSHQVSLTGFPRLQKDAGRGRLDEHLEGRIAPGTGALAGRYEVISTIPVPAGTPAPGGTRWSGISGAAVLADDGHGGDLLCGIVCEDRQADGGTRLTATPVSHLLTDQQGEPSEFYRLVHRHTGWDLVLEPIEPAPLLKPATADRDLDSPAALLRVDAEAVAFYGRDQELAELHTWCTTGPPKIAIRVITGPGGQGKTRLARHLTDTLSRKGWVTGHLRSDLTDHDTPPDLDPLTTALPLLLVFDYAETRPRLLRRLITHLHTTRHRVRLLLLARSDGGWRTETLSTTAPVRRLLASAPVVPLGPLQPAGLPDEGRIEAFRAAARDLARLLPRLPSVPDHDWHALAESVRPADDLAHPRYDNVLTLQMTALVTLLQQGPRPATAAPGAPTEEILLEHEERFWEDSAEAPGFKLGLDTPTLKAAVAVAALCGAASVDAATDVLNKALPAVPTHKTARTAAWLAQLYPADSDRYWGTLQPDRIAEYHATRVLARHGVDLPALLTAADPSQQAQAVIVLARAAIAHYNASRTTDSDDVLRALDAALDTACLTKQALEVASAALPYSRIVNSLAVRLAAALIQDPRELSVENPVAHVLSFAILLANFGTRLFEMGRREEALAATARAVNTCRSLVVFFPAVVGPYLASLLSNLGVDLSKVGRRAEALAVTVQAVDIYRQLAATDPASYEPDLARLLVNLGSRLSEVGRRAEALAVTEQAVDIYRQLAATDPAAYEPGLATSLSNLGVELSEVGRRAEALAVTVQAVDIYRQLAATDPAAYEPDLARLLVNLGSRLSEVGRRAEALAVTVQAVDIYRQLAATDPAAYEPGLATSLSNLGVDLSKVGRRAEALAVTVQAVDIYRQLAATDPASYEPDLARLLVNLGSRLSEVGRRAEALAVTVQAVDIYRQLAATDPAAYEPDLASLLTDLSKQLLEAGRLADALATIGQAIDIYLRPADTRPAAYAPLAANALAIWASIMANGGHLTEALSATVEAEKCLRALTAAEPFLLSQLHAVLHLQVQLLDALGHLQDAATVRRWLEENPLPPDSHN
ncbi:tetratricopeptide repeat protein (plasmid) [Streptomyces sp. NBC_00161]|uniref:tetratricopeptide repeat protein n=1 Tax=Streptomyces sp. NBC_00161 TaxID=2975671 RepID=UPI002F9124E2